MEYVLNPNDPMISPIYENLKVNEVEKLDRGLISVNMDTNNLSKDMSQQEELNSINYVSLNLTLDKAILKKYTDEEKAEVVVGLQNILKQIIDKKLNSPIEFVNVIEQEKTYLFVPYTTLGTLVFENSKYLADFVSSFDFSYFIGYTLLSDSGLTRYLVEKWIDENQYNTSDLNIKYYNVSGGYISLMPLFNPYMNQFIERFEYNLSNLIKQGYFSYTFGIHDIEDLHFVRELCSLYNISIISSKDLSTLICQTNVDFKTSLEEWIRNNLPLIKAGQFPEFSFSFDFSFYNDYIRLYGEQFKDVVLNYVTYLAYAKLSDEHPIIKPFIMSTRINEDLSISVYLPSYSLVEKLKSIVQKYLNEGISYLNDGKLSGVWNIETCLNLKEGIIKRWIVQEIDNDAYPMIFKDKNEVEILIHRSSLGIKYPSPFNFGKEEMKKAEDTLTNKLREYYSKEKVCHDDIEPVTLDNISKMNLEELLNIIPIEENGMIYCFSDETISRLVDKINPLTRRALSEKTLLTRRYLENGWRGLFNIGVLFGLYDEVPIKTNVQVNVGIIKVRRIPVDVNRRDLVGNVFLVEVIFEDGTYSPLFEISLPMVQLELLDDLRTYVNKLWYEGYFLTYWISAVVLYLKPKSFETSINSSIFLHAADSIFDGNVALETLKSSSEMY